MCLYVLASDSTPKVAEEDIIVYKFAITNELGMFAPYYKVQYPNAGEVMKANLDYTPLKNFEYDDHIPCAGTVSRGLHSFAELESANKIARTVSKQYHHQYRYNIMDLALIKCRIPKGATYYSGKFAREATYASNQLIIDEVINVIKHTETT